MNACDAIRMVVEGATPKGWEATHGIYANLSSWPDFVQYYVKCPKCGSVHGDYKTMREASRRRLCDTCSVEAINALKKEIQKVKFEPGHKPKPMTKIIGEAEEVDPFSIPPDAEPEGVPEYPEDDPSYDAKAETTRMLTGTWVDNALREFSEDESIALEDIAVVSWSGEKEQPPYDEMDNQTRLTLKHGNKAWIMFKNDDLAEAAAIERVTEYLRESPEMFKQNFIERHIDKEKLRNWLGDVYDYWENDVRDLDYDDLLEKMVNEGRVDSDDPMFFKKDGSAKAPKKSSVAALNTHMEEYIESDKPVLEDPMEYMEEIHGKDDAVKQAIEAVGIDVAAAAKEAVRSDGVAHFLAR